MVKPVCTNILEDTVAGFWGTRSFPHVSWLLAHWASGLFLRAAREKWAIHHCQKKWGKYVIWQQISPSCSLGSCFFIEWANVSNKNCGKEVFSIDISIHSQGRKTYPAVYMDSCWFLIWNSKAKFGNKAWWLKVSSFLEHIDLPSSRGSTAHLIRTL